jgi:integrase
MPARQRGFARKRGQRWLAGWHENGKQRTRGGFETKTAALDYANGKAVDAVARRNALRFGDVDTPPVALSTVEELVDAFLTRHRVDEATLRTLRFRLNHATAAFGERSIETLTPIELDVWRSQLPALSAHYIFRAFRQVLEYAVAMGLVETNPTARIRNVRATADRRQIHPFETWDEVEAISAEMDPRYAAIPIVLVGTGLRPEELFALERAAT